MRLAGSVALITGASRGIGAAIATRFAREGAHVALCARNAAPLEELAGTIRAAGGAVSCAAFDVGDHARLQRFVEEVGSAHGRVDVLVNNAPSVTYAAIADMGVAAFRQDFHINVDSAFVACAAALKVMIPRRSGAIINIASVAGLLAMRGLSAYGAAKAALMHFTRAVAVEAGPHNVRCNAIVPGVINTPATLQAFAGPAQDYGRRIAQMVPLQRFGEPHEVASLALFLASAESAYITAACIAIDGGKTAALAMPEPP
jgi:meso-butanediol dehydrogenase/(S,S)-butanediol dehydrogenase/diacetyl reductase